MQVHVLVAPSERSSTDLHPADLHPTDLHPTDLHPTDKQPADLHPTDLNQGRTSITALFIGNFREKLDASEPTTTLDHE